MVSFQNFQSIFPVILHTLYLEWTLKWTKKSSEVIFSLLGSFLFCGTNILTMGFWLLSSDWHSGRIYWFCDHTGAFLTDLSKSFDCILHDLLLAKRNAYGLVGRSTAYCLSSNIENKSYWWNTKIYTGPINF